MILKAIRAGVGWVWLAILSFVVIQTGRVHSVLIFRPPCAPTKSNAPINVMPHHPQYMVDNVGGSTEKGPPIVGNLITSKDESPVISHGFDYRVCPNIGAIDILVSQIPTLPHYGLVWQKPRNGRVG